MKLMDLENKGTTRPWGGTGRTRGVAGIPRGWHVTAASVVRAAQGPAVTRGRAGGVGAGCSRGTRPVPSVVSFWHLQRRSIRGPGWGQGWEHLLGPPAQVTRTGLFRGWKRARTFSVWSSATSATRVPVSSSEAPGCSLVTLQVPGALKCLDKVMLPGSH